MRHLKTIKLFENLEDKLQDVKNLKDNDFYKKVSQSAFYSLKPYSFYDAEYIKNKISEIIGYKTKIEYSIVTKFYYIVVYVGDIEIELKLLMVEDEWFIVSVDIPKKTKFGRMIEVSTYKCDQEEGLYAFLHDFKKIIDKL